MKIGETITLEKLTYRVERLSASRVLLRRVRRMPRHIFAKQLKAKRWRALVSANFILDVKTGRTLSNYELMEMGYSAAAIERFHETLPRHDPEAEGLVANHA